MTQVKALEHKEVPIFGVCCSILHESNHVLTTLIASTGLEFGRTDLWGVNISFGFS
jgi:hypothetical protein